MSDDSLRSELRAYARRRGAVSMRFTHAGPEVGTQERLVESFARGDLATWGYGPRYAHAAATPQAILAGARSVVCVAVPFATPEVAHAPLTGRVSNYAWSTDYHRRMKTLLRELAAIIEAVAGAGSTAIVCDTAPLAERAFAARAGLAWVGKHTNAIHPDFGSFVFLGEIVTTAKLAPDPPLRKTCGSCSRCVDVCPTGALRGDYTIDATRCISDLTQRTGSIPRALRPLIGSWVWGCDLCQLVCPPTQKAGFRAGPENSAISQDVGAPSLVRLLRLRSGEFRRLFARTAMGWRGAAVLRRNAAVALGNALDRATVPALAQALEDDPHAMVRVHVAWALGRIASPGALSFLQNRLERESDREVREEIVSALEPFGASRALQQVI